MNHIDEAKLYKKPQPKNEEQFDLKKELDKVGITEVTVQKGDVYDLDGSRLMCGDS